MTTTSASTIQRLTKVAQVAGVLTAVGYLFLVMLMAVRRDEIPQAGPILSIAVLAMISGVATVIVGSFARGVARSHILSGIGLLLLTLTLMLSWKATLSVGLRLLYGGESGLLAFGFGMAVFVLGCLQARAGRPESALVRVVLGVGAGVVLMLYLVQLLVALAEGTARRSLYADIFNGGDAVMIIYTVLLMLALLSILTLALVALSNEQDSAKLGRAATRVAQGVLYLVVGLTFLRFFLAVFQNSALVGRQVLDLATEVMAGLLPFGCVAWLCVSAVRESMLALAGISLAATGHELQPTAAPPSHPHVVSTPAPPRATPHVASAPPPARVAAPVVAAAATSTADMETLEEQLKKLKRLREQDLITDDEYWKKRAETLTKL